MLRGLYAITPQMTDTLRLCKQVEAALDGGVKLIQYRDKSRDIARRRVQAAALQNLCAERDALLIINDDVALAQDVGASGAHLGQADGSLAAARAAWPRGLIGATCHNQLALAMAAHEGGASYVAFGAFFPSTVKPDAVRAEPRLIASAKSATGLPVCAIGGITLDRAPALIAAGADMLAVITDLFDAPDITARARAYTHLFEPT